MPDSVRDSVPVWDLVIPIRFRIQFRFGSGLGLGVCFSYGFSSDSIGWGFTFRSDRVRLIGILLFSAHALALFRSAPESLAVAGDSLTCRVDKKNCVQNLLLIVALAATVNWYQV